MLKKMQWHFILLAMAVFGTVMFVLTMGINVVNYSIIVSTQDRILERVLEYIQKNVDSSSGGLSLILEMPLEESREAYFRTRIFAAQFGDEGEEFFVSEDYSSSVNEDIIKQYATDILSIRKAKGFYKDYRYRVGKEESSMTVVFLDASEERRMMSVLFRRSAMTFSVSLLAVFVLTALFSKRAIKPYVQNMERQKRFITDASHELKTPLASITTSADILAMGFEENEWVSNIQKQTVRLNHLVAGLVMLSRLDEERPFLEKAVFSFSEAAWEITEPFASLARQNGKIYTDHIEEHLEFMGDRNAIQQMISILLDNAVKYSGEGGEIKLDVYRRHNKICVEVFNTCELPERIEAERFFERFYRPDESRSANKGGTGIGLSVAQAVAEAHGGKITVKSSGGKTILFKAVL